MKIRCPKCLDTDFNQDIEDNQIYTCEYCGEEVRVLTSNQGFLTYNEKNWVKNQKHSGGQ